MVYRNGNICYQKMIMLLHFVTENLLIRKKTDFKKSFKKITKKIREWAIKTNNPLTLPPLGSSLQVGINLVKPH